jgi:YidC/Oxa1 family membrane protein insertase
MPIESKRVLFYSEHASYTINFRPIMDQLIQKYDLKICYITSDPNDPILETKEKNVTVLYSRILLTFLMGILTDKTVCVMTMSELHNNPVIKRSINDVHYIYVFHAMMSTIMTHKFGGFDHFDTIVCVGQYHVDEIRKTEEVYKVKKRRIVEGGYTRLDDIRRQYCEYLQNAPPKEKYHVLFGPSWGPNSFVEYQTEQAKVMIDSLLANNFFVTIRYHPETVRRRDDVIKFFDDHYEQNINVKIEKSVANNESILKADTIITDWSGIALEYAFGTERPVISIDVPPKHQNDRYGELGLLPFEMQVRDKIGIIVPPENLEGIGERVKEIMNTKDAWRDKIIETRNKNIFYLDQAAEKTAEAITGIANEQRKKK